MSRKPVVMVLGSSGNVGMATLQTLTSQYSGKVDVIAGVRNPDKADKLKEIKGITVVKATMGEDISNTLKGADTLFIIMPPTENRLEICRATAVAADAAGVKQVLFLNGLLAELKGSSVGRQNLEMESRMKDLNLQLSIIRVPFFLENYFAHAYTIKKDSSVYSPLDPSKPVPTAAVGDIGRAAAAILVDFPRHSGKVYRIVGNQHTFNEFCDEISAQLGRTIKYNRQSYEEAAKGMLEMGLEKSMVDNMMEANKLIDEGGFSYEVSELNHYKEITGTDPITLHSWVASNKGAFQ